MMFACLIVALFLPELWVLFGINSNTLLDVVLTITMLLFIFEIVALSSLDVTYFLSFFFFMDILGTFSMIFHISYMLGVDNTEAETLETGSGTDTYHTLMLLRAARAARIGARIGRVSRAVRLLRFLPFLANVSDSEKQGITAQISGQLANLLAIRVAALTVILVMMIPLLDLFSFPQSDKALAAWAERLSADLAEGATALFNRELNEMVSFFSVHDYGPFMACIGRQHGDDFICTQDIVSGWTPILDEPPRGASILQVHTSTFMVAFNMHSTFLLEHGLAIVNIFFTIGIMIFCALALSSVVNETAVRPLEKMLTNVRTVAQTVFKYSAEVIEQDQQDATGEEYNVDNSNEMKLLEAVVEKLAIIAQLSTAAPAQLDEDMGDEEIGYLTMLHGRELTSSIQAVGTGSPMRSSRSSIAGAIQAEVPRLGVSLDIYNSLAFNALALNPAQQSSVCVYTIASYLENAEGWVTTVQHISRLQSFVGAVESAYLPNPFHNFSHATDVVHGVSRMMRLVQSERILSALEHYSLLVSAVGHDLGHPGVTTGYLVEVGHELALKYNDISPLENMHVAKLYEILANEEQNVFSMLSKERYKEARKYCIDCVLHTDMAGHQAMIKDLQMLYQMNVEMFTQPHGGSDTAEFKLFAENKQLVMDNILHSADVSNPCREWLVTHAWAHQVMDEFFLQGDQEKMLGIPVQFDRDKIDRPNLQIGFVEFMIVPFYVAQIRLWPKLCEYGDNLGNNIAQWEEVWLKGSSPNEDAKGKTRTRIEKVKTNLDDAKKRA